MGNLPVCPLGDADGGGNAPSAIAACNADAGGGMKADLQGEDVRTCGSGMGVETRPAGAEGGQGAETRPVSLLGEADGGGNTPSAITASINGTGGGGNTPIGIDTLREVLPAQAISSWLG